MTLRYATFTAEWWLLTKLDPISQPKFRIDFQLLLNLGTAGLTSELLIHSGSDFRTPCSLAYLPKERLNALWTDAKECCMVLGETRTFVQHKLFLSWWGCGWFALGYMFWWLQHHFCASLYLVSFKAFQLALWTSEQNVRVMDWWWSGPWNRF